MEEQRREQIDPHIDWERGDEFDTFIVDVAGFTKDDLKIEVDRSGRLKIVGERTVSDDGRLVHFLKQIDLPGGHVDAAAIRVQLDKGLLYVRVPPRSAAGGGSEQHPTEHPKWRLVLNVVLAVFLLWLVAYAKSGGQIKNE